MRQQTGDTSRSTERSGRTSQSPSSGSAGATGTQASGAQGGMAGASTPETTGVQGGAARSDQERPRQVSQEATSGRTGVQRGGRQQGALTGREAGQPSLLPAFMAHPGLMASAFMSDPFAFANVMNQEMDRLFSTFGGAGSTGLEQGGARQAGRGLARWNPQMEVVQRGNELAVCADLPGMNPEDVNIDVEDGMLTISGERRQSNEERGEGFYSSERSYGAFARTIPLPDGVDEDQINARFENGVLEVRVPLPEQQRQRSRRVQIQGAATGQPQGARGASAPSATTTPGTTGERQQKPATS